MKQKRWKSTVAWSALAALLLFILNNYGLLSYLGLTVESYNEFVGLIFGALIAFGIFNDPTSKDKF